MEDNYIIDNFPPHIIDTFGGIDKFITYPVIDFKNEHMGGIMYLDRFLVSDVSESITIGIDYYKRPLVILNLEFEYDFDSIPEISREYYNRKDKHSGVATVFQRYTDSSGWTTASAYMHMQDVFQTGMLMDETYLSIKEFEGLGSPIAGCPETLMINPLRGEDGPASPGTGLTYMYPY